MRRKIQVLALIVLIISIYIIVTNLPYAGSVTELSESVEGSEGQMDDAGKEVSGDLQSGEKGGLQTKDEEAEEPDVVDPLVRDIDFEAYREMNVYAYIYIPNTNIDYPILQHESDNSYYLNYNIDGTKGYPGCIYTEKENEKDFTDSNTVIYGHNMKNGSMFHDIHLFENKEFFEENPYVYIYTPERVLQYEIFAVYTASDDHLLYICDFDDRDAFGNYLEEVQNRTAFNMVSETALIRQDIRLTADDRIISLQTCTRSEDCRTVIQAVLVGEYS